MKRKTKKPTVLDVVRELRADLHQRDERMMAQTLGAIGSVRQDVRKATPGAFVCVLVEGMPAERPATQPWMGGASRFLPEAFARGWRPFQSDRKQVTAGDACQLAPGERRLFELRSQLAIADVRVIVLCDLSRVRVGSIMLGTDVLTAFMGPCPIACAEAWLPGHNVVVELECLP